VRGADQRPRGTRSAGGGPSPRARGRQLPQLGRHAPMGTIPACAGPTPALGGVGVDDVDHPRVRGADHQRPDRGARLQRTIPACAGPTPPGASQNRRSPGPSPRARGRQHLLDEDRDVLGTIPACAGPTTCGDDPLFCVEDHPRVRGADAASQSARGRSKGPSPRARGRPRSSRSRVSPRRTIPACAGPTACCRGSAAVAADHPRVRGADTERQKTLIAATGPSPRARGRPPPRRPAALLSRTIPACAGPTWRSIPTRWRRSDHPRVRGADPYR